MFYNMKIDPNKKYKFVIGNRGYGRRYFLYNIRNEYLKEIGDYICRGFCDKIIPQNESKVNYAFVEMITAQERFRNYEYK